jgi:hypothetical protein
MMVPLKVGRGSQKEDLQSDALLVGKEALELC